MEKFNNTSNQQAAQKSLHLAASACFALSTLSSAVAIWSGVMAFLDTKFAGASNSFFIGAGAFAVVLYFCYMVDFFGISKVGKLFFTEVAAWASKAFVKYSTLRLIAMSLWAIIFFAFSLISFSTSYYGSDMAKSFATPKVDVSGLKSISSERAAAEAKITAPYAQRRDAIEAQRAADLKGAGNVEMKKLAGTGNAWAVGEIEKSKSYINKKYDAQLVNIDKMVGKDKAVFAGTQDAVDKAQLAAITANIESQQSQANAVGIVTLAFGVAPLLIGILIIGLMSVAEVGDKVERTTKASTKGFTGSGSSSRPRAPQAQNTNYPNRGF
jgi:hypothetical protein